MIVGGRSTPGRELREQVVAVACSVLRGRTTPAAGRQLLQDMQQRVAESDSGAWHAAQAVVGVCLRLDALPGVALPRGVWDELMRWLAITRSDLRLRHHVFWRMEHLSIYSLASLVLFGLSLRSAVVEGAWLFFGLLWLVFGLIWQELPFGARGYSLDRARYVPFRDSDQWQRHAPLVAGLDVPNYDEHRRLHQKTCGAFTTSRRVHLKLIALLPVTLVWRSLPERIVVWMAQELS